MAHRIIDFYRMVMKLLIGTVSGDMIMVVMVVVELKEYIIILVIIINNINNINIFMIRIIHCRHMIIIIHIVECTRLGRHGSNHHHHSSVHGYQVVCSETTRCPERKVTSLNFFMFLVRSGKFGGAVFQQFVFLSIYLFGHGNWIKSERVTIT